MKRPLSICCLVFVLSMLCINARIKAPPFCLTEEQKNSYILGEVSKKEYKQNQIYIYISNVIFLEPDEMSSGLNFQNYKKQSNNVGCICYLDEQSMEPYIGEHVVLKGNMKDFDTATNLGMFDQKEYYEKKGLHFLVFESKVLYRDQDVNLLHEYLFSIRKKILGILLEELEEKNAGVAATMVLGDREYLDGEEKTRYQYSGISHVLAISGLHISILGYGLFSLLKRMHFPTTVASIFVTCFLITYGIMVGGSVSTLRASIMFLVFMGGKVTKRPYDLITALTFSGALITFFNGGEIDVGFYLSFGAVIGLTYISRILEKIFTIGRNRIKDLFFRPIISGFAIFLATTPILMYYFYGVAPLSIFANIIVIPLMSFLIVAIICLIMTSVTLPIMTPIFRILCEFILHTYEKIINVSEIIPGYFLVTGKVQIWRIFFYYVVLFLFLVSYSIFHPENRRGKMMHRLQFIGNWMNKKSKLSFVICLCFLWGILCFSPQRNLQIEVLDVGQGDGIYIDTGTGYTLFIDGGSTTVTELGKYRLQPYFMAKGVRRIDYLFFTHYDEDHINGWIEIFEEMIEKDGRRRVLEVTGLVISEQTKDQKEGEELLELARKLGIKIYTINKGDVMDFSSVCLRCIYPGDILTDSVNENSLTLLLTKDNFSMLLTGDLEGKGEEIVSEEIKSLYMDKEIDSIEVLKVGHHGSKNASSTEFLETVAADIGIISYGKNNNYGHPSEEVLNRMETYEMRYLGTGEYGAILIESDGDRYWVETFK